MVDLVLLCILILVLLGYAFLTGFTDAANSIASPIITRVLTPNQAVILASTFDFVGALTGTAVATTITSGFVDISSLSLGFVLSVMLATMSWSIMTYLLGIPVSETHGLIGAMIGAAFAIAGGSIVIWANIIPIVIAIIISPILGIFFSFIFTSVFRKLSFTLSKTTGNRIFGIGQIITCCSTAFAHGSNDGQKPMGMITMSIAIYLGQSTMEVPLWVKIITASLVGIGAYLGGFRIIKTIGLRLSKIDKVQGFTSQLSASFVIETASRLGIPVSSTHIVTSSIAGAGVARSKNTLNWGLLADIGLSWLATIPATAILGFGMAFAFVVLLGL